MHLYGRALLAVASDVARAAATITGLCADVLTDVSSELAQAARR